MPRSTSRLSILIPAALGLLLALPALAAPPARGATVPATPAPAPARPATPAPAPEAVPARAAVTPAVPRVAPQVNPVPIWQRRGILVEAGGRGLYTYTPDETGQSRCDRNCEALWPPYYAEPDAKPFGPFTLARSSDGRPMWAWKGQPLYRWISDRRRGDAGGEGVNDVWHLVRLDASERAQVPYYVPTATPRRPPARTPTQQTR